MAFSHYSVVLFDRAYLLSLVVEKSKKCVDFTFTLYFLHIMSCAMYQEVLLASRLLLVD